MLTKGISIDDAKRSIAEQMYLIGKALWLINPTAKLPTVVAKSGLSDEFFASATKPWGEQGLSAAGRALQKHAGREGSVFEGIKFSHKTAIKMA